jgi:hypothetical protein
MDIFAALLLGFISFCKYPSFIASYVLNSIQHDTKALRNLFVPLCLLNNKFYLIIF